MANLERANLERMRLGLPDLGVGVGLRIPHYRHIFERRPRVDWFEIISENFMVDGGMPIANLERALASYRLVQHGVSLSIGSADPLDFDYLRRLKALLRKVGSPWVSDHLCWSGAHGVHLHDLLPLPYTDEAVRHVAARARAVQDFLEVRLALENVSSYLTFTSSRMSEWAFLSAVVEEADCGILLDVNNVYVSSYNHGFDPGAYIDGVPHHRIVQIHLAGHTHHGKYILDTHSDHVADPVWALYRRALGHTGDVSTLIEWDDDLPAFEVVAAEAEKARAIREEVARARAA
ncbi:MNIO family bufferin maturase [Sorangium sp. So ce861]|uniref:MNIO family bufferin maturase n=1 Tax=Sorangium sp. So ce861 TaxID=3133323 RepID=UPI003F62A93E